MRKRLSKLVLSIFLFVCVITAISFTVNAAKGDIFTTSNNVVYYINSEGNSDTLGTVSIKNGEKVEGTLIIPEKVKNEVTGIEYQVTSLGFGSFRYSGATQIYLPESVKSAPSGSPNNPVFVNMKSQAVVYYVNPSLENLLKGGDEGGGCSFDKTTALAKTNGGVLNGSFTTGIGIGQLDSNFGRENSTFGGWYNNPHFNGTAITERTANTNDIEKYYARWQPNADYSIVMYSNGFDSAVVGDAFVSGTEYVVKENTYQMAGFEFANWMLSEYDTTNEKWEDVSTLGVGEKFIPESGTLYRLTAQWELSDSIFSTLKDHTEMVYDSGYNNIWVQSNAYGINNSSFSWYKYVDNNWVNVSANAQNKQNGRYISSRLYFQSINDSGRYKCIVQIENYGKSYIAEKEIEVVITPLQLEISAKQQVVLKGESINTTLKYETVNIKGKNGRDDNFNNSYVYENTKIELKEGITTNVPGVYEDAIVISNNGLDSISNAESYIFTFKPGKLIVKDVPQIIWNNDNIYEYAYTGEKINTQINVTANGVGGLGDPAGNLTILYNGDSTKPTEVGEYTIKAVYKSANNLYSDYEEECVNKLVIEPAELNICINAQEIATEQALPILDAYNHLTYTSSSLSDNIVSEFKSKIASAISNGKLTFKFMDGEQEITTTPEVGVYDIIAVISSDDMNALDSNIKLTFTNAKMTVKKSLDVTVNDIEALFTGEPITYDKNISGIPSGLSINIEYSGDDGWTTYAPTNVGTYRVKISYAGDDTYKSFEKYADLIIKPIDILVKAKDKAVAKDVDLSVVTFDENDIEIIVDEDVDPSLSEVIKVNLKDFVKEMLKYELLDLTFTSSGNVTENRADDVTFVFNINGSLLTLDQLKAEGRIPITPMIANWLNLPGLFENLNVDFEKGDLIVKEKVNISFKEDDVFELEDIDDSWLDTSRNLDIDKMFVTEFTFEDVMLTTDNIIVTGKEGLPTPTGNVTIEYCNESDGDGLFSENNYPWFGNYYARITVTGDENYGQTVSYALVSVKQAELVVSAREQKIDVGGTVNTTVSAFELKGDVLNNATIKGILDEALPTLVNYHVFELVLDQSVDTSIAKEYKKAIKVNFDSSKLIGDYADAASFFDIKTEDGNLIVGLDYSIIEQPNSENGYIIKVIGTPESIVWFRIADESYEEITQNGGSKLLNPEPGATYYASIIYSNGEILESERVTIPVPEEEESVVKEPAKATVEFVVDGKVWRTYRVTKGADIRMPEVPEKEGYVGEWDHDGENIRTTTTITAKYTKVEEPVNNNDLSDYANFQLPVYANSRVTNIATANGSITVDGYMFKANADCNAENSIWREIIFVNEEDYSMAKAYRKQVTPVYNTWLNKNMTATGNGTYALDYANYTVTFSNTDINNYVGNTAATRMTTGSYLAYMRISDGTDSYLFPLKDIVLSDGSTLALPSGFEVVDTTTRALRYIVK